MENTEETIVETVEEPVVETKKPFDNVQTLDDLPDNLKTMINKKIDQERTKASKTASQKGAQTATELLTARLDEITLHSNQLEAKEVLRDAGMSAEDIANIVEVTATVDKEKTMSATQKVADAFKKALTNALKTENKATLHNMPTPQGSTKTAKSFKEMTFQERLDLKKSDLATYNAEMKNISSARI